MAKTIIMIITKEQQEKILAKYMKNHSTLECSGFVDGINETIALINRIEIPFKIIETNENCCANCKGVNTGGFAWIYCELRKDNDDKFDGDCGELLGCNHFNKALAKKEKDLKNEI